MKTGSAQSLFTAWYDRSPTPRFILLDGFLAPHALTSRGAYTVPAGQRALLTHLSFSILRLTTASAQSPARLWASFTPSGGAQVVIALLRGYTGAVGDQEFNSFAVELHMSGGDNIEVFSVDNATGGTRQFFTAVYFNEFAV